MKRKFIRVAGGLAVVLAAFAVVVLSRRPESARAQVNLDFEATDGIFDAAFRDDNFDGVVELDLSLAADGPWDGPSSGNGVYDKDKWAVVFKFSSVTIESFSRVTIKNHASRAPVVWLVEGDVFIGENAELSLRGEDSGFDWAGPGEPGPGGFRGGFGQALNSGPSAGFGPGGASMHGAVDSSAPYSSSGSYATVGARGNPNDPSNVPGPTYGNSLVLPLIGGSGGAASLQTFPARQNGGAGGGAILIVARGKITINGRIDASGGSSFSLSGSGSGGSIRLVANEVRGTGLLLALGGTDGTGRGFGGNGRIRVEADLIDFPQLGEPEMVAAPLEDPPMIFPPPSAPELRVVSFAGLPVGDDPHADFPLTDVQLSTTEAVTLEIEARNLPLGPPQPTVQVRIVPRSGQDVWLNAFLKPGADNTFEQSTWTIDPISLPHGFATVQARAELPQN